MNLKQYLQATSDSIPIAYINTPSCHELLELDYLLKGVLNEIYASRSYPNS